MKADPDKQEQLLHLQSIDTTVQQLRHRLTVLPQLAELADLASRDDEIRGRHAGALGALEDARSELVRCESDVSVVEARIARNSERLTHTSSVKDIAALESDLDGLRKRLSDLEDAELVLMERVEEREQQFADIEKGRQKISDDATRLGQERDAAASDINAEIAAAEQERGTIVAHIPADLQELYDKRRATRGGIGAALLRARTCGGCTITLTGSDLDAVRRAPVDQVVFCPDCDRILVRTAESGL